LALSQSIVGLVVDPRDPATVILGSPSFALQNRARARLHWEIGSQSVAEKIFQLRKSGKKNPETICSSLVLSEIHLLSPIYFVPVHTFIVLLTPSFLSRCDCHTYTDIAIHGTTLYHALIYTSTMALQVVVPNTEPKCPRNDRLQEAPSAKNAQGLFPPEACIFVGKYVIDPSKYITIRLSTN
jgi:hypothetical protein